MNGENKTCDSCNAKEGCRRPVGRYIVELHTFEVDNVSMQLCITCFKDYSLKKKKNSSETGEETPSFYSSILKFYKQRIHVRQKDL